MSAAELFGVKPDYTEYLMTMQVRELLVGGIPSDPSITRKWLEARLEVDEATLQELFEQTIKERNTPMSVTEKVDALMESDGAPSINGFPRLDDGQLAYPGRCLKAGFREAANSAYPGVDWDGKKGAKGVAPRKGLMSTLAERVFVRDYLIPLGVQAAEISSNAGEGPAWVEERVKHVMTPQGPRSSINRVEVVHRPLLTATIRIHDDFLSSEALGRILTRLEDIGIGADRGRSDGQFDLVGWEEVKPGKN